MASCGRPGVEAYRATVHAKSRSPVRVRAAAGPLVRRIGHITGSAIARRPKGEARVYSRPRAREHVGVLLTVGRGVFGDEEVRHAMRDLGQLIDRRSASYATRFSEDLLTELMFVGDALADDAVAALKEVAYDIGGSQLPKLHELEKRGDPRALAFFDDVRRRPDWLEPSLLRRGQHLALAYIDLYGVSLMHSLFAGGMFARATLVTASTGRLGSHPARRIQETGAFIGAILEPGGLEPDALGFETAVRVRLLHGSIRAWLGKSPGFTDAYVGVPLDQTMLAMTLGLFDYLNLRSLARMGVSWSDDDLRAHHHLWRYIGHLLGIDGRLLTASLDEERELWSSLVAHQAFPELGGEDYLKTTVATVARLMGTRGRGKLFLRNLYLYLSGSGWFGVESQPRWDPLVPLVRGAGFSVSTAHSHLPGVADWMERWGASKLANASEMARSHGFGVSVEEDEGAARTFEVFSAGVRARFVGDLQGA